MYQDFNECLFCSDAEERGAKKDRGSCKFIRLPATTNFHATRMRPPNPLWRLFISSVEAPSSNLRSRQCSTRPAHANTKPFRSLPLLLYHTRYTNLSSPTMPGQFSVLTALFHMKPSEDVEITRTRSH